MPAINPQAVDSAQAFMAPVAKIDVLLCPCCKMGRQRDTATLKGSAQLPAPGATVMRRLLCAHRLKWRLAALRAMLRVALFTPDVSHQKCVPYAKTVTVSRLRRVG